MEIAILFLNLFIVWLFSVLAAFVCGFYLSRIKKHTSKRKPHTAKETEEFKKTVKEFENFLSYTGQPQNVIND